ncbi:MAG: PAS domain S-box protein [Deltaproteobacteria bacterium]|nr:PAS domain S-box protein [Deltaproteobacteria bacterium]
MKDRDRKRIIILLRWGAIIVTSYLILLGRGKVADPNLSHLLVLGYILSNIVLIFLPIPWFSNPKFFYPLVIGDTGIILLGMYLSEKMVTDFYLAFFLIIIFASMSRNFKLLMFIGGSTAILYGFLLYSWGLLISREGSSYILRIPFIFIMTAFYGYLVKTLTKEKHQELSISEDKYRGLFENANEGILILKDPSLQIADVNREAEKATHYHKDELLGKEASDLFSPEAIEKAKIYFNEIIEKGEGRIDTLSLRKKEGIFFEADISTKRIELGEESFFQMIFRDVTEKRRLERKIIESKRNLEAIFDGIGDQLSIQSPDFEVLRVNKAVIERHSTTFQDLIGKKCYEAYYQKTSPCEGCPLLVTVETKQPASAILKFPEAERVQQIFSYPVSDEKDNFLYLIEYVKDITEEQKLQEQLIQSEKLAGIGILASGVAHEINNPLSGIIGMAEIALEEEDPSKKKDYLMDILTCGQRIGEIVNGLRSYSRTAKKEELGAVDLQEILETSLKMVQLATKSAFVDVIKKYQPIEKIKANPGEIQQVFTNLITNAFQAMNGKENKLTLSSRSLKDFVEIKVGDNGVGISPQYVKKIFDPFFTTKKMGEGTGLGLNIVYRIVTKYEGTIEVESTEGAGTQFTLKFPKWRDER